MWISTKTKLSGDEVLKFKFSKKVFNELKLNANIKKSKTSNVNKYLKRPKIYEK